MGVGEKRRPKTERTVLCRADVGTDRGALLAWEGSPWGGCSFLVNSIVLWSFSESPPRQPPTASLQPGRTHGTAGEGQSNHMHT